jgi:hypothetical protein
MLIFDFVRTLQQFHSNCEMKQLNNSKNAIAAACYVRLSSIMIFLSGETLGSVLSQVKLYRIAMTG